MSCNREWGQQEATETSWVSLKSNWQASLKLLWFKQLSCILIKDSKRALVCISQKFSESFNLLFSNVIQTNWLGID